MIPVRPLDPAQLPAPEPDAGLGALRTERGNLPLEEIDLTARVTGLAVRTELTQTFRNSCTEPLEATYVFPLPDRAAVTSLRLEADGHVVEGVLRERGAARAEYDQAIEQGRRAAIVEEERPGVFTMRVGNLAAGERVVVRLVLAGLLPVDDGEATFRFPLVVAPRYIPGTPLGLSPVGEGTEPDTDAVPDASRITPPVLLPGFPNPIRLSATLDLDPAGLDLTGIAASLPLRADPENPLRLHLEPGRRADQDLIVRLALRAATAAFATNGTAFALTVLPPADSGTARPRDVVLVLDRSGSMSGWKMVAARRAAARIVDSLGDADSFAVLAFDNTVERPPRLPHGLAPAVDRNRFRAVEHLATVDARGGTELLSPLREAIALLSDADRERVLVLVTDGQVGNEDQILRDLAPGLAGIRVHTVGVDTAVNAAFLRRLAAAGGGRCELVESQDRLDAAMRAIHRRIATPLVTGLRVSGAGIDPDSLAPQPIPDLFADAPLLLTGRLTGDAGEVTVTGTALDGSAWSQTLAAQRSDNPALSAIWARARIRDLEDRYASAAESELSELERTIVATSLEFGVLCRFTAFVAVDNRVVEGTLRRVIQPVDLPAGWARPEVAFATFAGPAAPMAAPMGAPARRAHPTSRRKYAAAFRPAEPRPEIAPLPAAPESVREFARIARDRLLDAAPAERAAALADLAAEITRHLDGFRADGLGRPELALLAALAEELGRPDGSAAEIEHRRLHALDVLEPLAETGEADEPSKRFWKR